MEHPSQTTKRENYTITNHSIVHGGNGVSHNVMPKDIKGHPSPLASAAPVTSNTANMASYPTNNMKNLTPTSLSALGLAQLFPIAPQQQIQQTQQQQLIQQLTAAPASSQSHQQALIQPSIQPAPRTPMIPTIPLPTYNGLPVAQPIHVTTAGLPDPIHVPLTIQTSLPSAPSAASNGGIKSNINVLHNNSKKAEVEKKVKLAAVPTMKLAAKSIVALNSTATTTSSLAKIGGITLVPNHAQHHPGGSSSSSHSNHQHSPPVAAVRNAKPQHHIHQATTKQLEEWLASSYSSASNATIIAQKKRKSGIVVMSDPTITTATKTTSQHTNVSQDNGIKKPTVSLKRPAPTSSRTQNDTHKYIKVVGGKHEVPRSIPNVS